MKVNMYNYGAAAQGCSDCLSTDLNTGQIRNRYFLKFRAMSLPRWSS